MSLADGKCRAAVVCRANTHLVPSLPHELQMPERVVAQAMNIAAYDDIQKLTEQVDEDYLRGMNPTTAPNRAAPMPASGARPAAPALLITSPSDVLR